MGKIGIEEDTALRDVAMPFVEFPRRNLRGEDDVLDAVARRRDGGKLHQGSADSLAS